MDEKKEKRVLNIELDENVKKVSITGLGDDETVVMKQELTEEELDQATGGMGVGLPGKHGQNGLGIDYDPCPKYSVPENKDLFYQYGLDCPNYCRAACSVNY